MIKLVNSYDELSFCDSSPYCAKIRALYKTYGNDYSFAKFWVQNGMAAISCVDGNVTLESAENADYDEIKEFLGFLGYTSVSCSIEVCEKLGFSPSSSSFIVKYCGNKKPDGFTSSDRYKDVHSLLVRCGFEMADYKEYLADFALRVNKGTAALSALFDNNKIIATASALFIAENSVLLGAVGTDPSERGKGFASEIVSSLAAFYSYNNKDVFLFCREDSLAEFYKKCGFKITGKWAQINFR